VVWGINHQTEWSGKPGLARGRARWHSLGHGYSGDTVLQNAFNGLLDKPILRSSHTWNFALNANTGGIIWKAPPRPGRAIVSILILQLRTTPGLVIAALPMARFVLTIRATAICFGVCIRDYETVNGEGPGAEVLMYGSICGHALREQWIWTFWPESGECAACLEMKKFRTCGIRYWAITKFENSPRGIASRTNLSLVKIDKDFTCKQGVSLLFLTRCLCL
jgi:hypothetical protein